MATKKHLETLGFDWEVGCCLPNIETLRTPDEKKEFYENVRLISQAMSGFHPLSLHFSEALGRSKTVLTGPPNVRRAEIILTTDPQETPIFRPKNNLYVDVFFNPLELPNISGDSIEIGALSVRLATEALERLSHWKGFPIDVCQLAIQAYQEAGYTYSWTIKESSVPGANARAKITGIISARQTTCELEISKEETPLYKSIIWDVEGTKWYDAHSFNKFVIEEKGFKVGSGNEMLVPSAFIDANEFPKLVRDILWKVS